MYNYRENSAKFYTTTKDADSSLVIVFTARRPVSDSIPPSVFEPTDHPRILGLNVCLTLYSGLFWFVGLYGISNFVGYLTPNPFLCK